MATQVGEAVIKLTFDGKDVKASLKSVSSEVEKSGSSSGKAWGNAWSTAAGVLVAKGVAKIANTITSSLGKAINRVDTINNFPKVMTALGYSSEEASGAIELMSDRLMGLPTSLDQSVGDIQKLAATMGNLYDGTVNATTAGLALNDMFLAGGKGQEVASRAMEQYNQMLAAGKPDMQSWRTLLDAAPGQLKQLAKTLLGASATSQDLYKALQEGNVSFEQMNEAIVRLDAEGGDGFESFEAQARAATGGIGTSIENLYNRLAQAIAKVIEHIGPDKIFNIIETISTSFKGLADIVINVFDFLAANKWILESIMAFFVGLLAMNIVSRVVNLFGILSAFAATNPVVLAIGAISAVLFLLMTHLDEVGQFFQTVFQGISDFVCGVATTIGEFFTSVWNSISSGAQQVWSFVTGIFSNLASFFGSIFSSAWNAVKNVFSTGGVIFMGIVDGITAAFRNIVNAIIGGINNVVAIPFNAINGFLNFLKGIDILGIKPFDWVWTIDVPQIPLLAQGGIVDSATTAIIGEDGKEAVLPLEKNTGNWAGLLAEALTAEMGTSEMDRPINVYMTNNINSVLDADDIGQVMMESIRRAA